MKQHVHHDNGASALVAHSMHHGGHHAAASPPHHPPEHPTGSIPDAFSTDPGGLAEAVRTPVIELRDGESFDLRATLVRKRIGGVEVKMLAYNGSVPGPTLKVRQGSEVTIRVTNETDIETTVHWHGLRVENRYDGVPYDTQAPIAVGERYTCRLRFPDAGVFWYHPHIREDYAQEHGLYGNIIVIPTEADYWPPVHREVALVLDDILIEDGRIAPVSRTLPNRTAMGRFGNVMLANGETEYALRVDRGEVVRLYLTNTANVRTFRFRIPGARMKLVGGDNGRYEREEFVENVLISPSERAIVDVLFDRPGRLQLEHRTPERTYQLGSVLVGEQAAEPSLAGEFAVLRTSHELEAERSNIAVELERPPDKTLLLVGSMLGMAEHGPGGHGGAGHAEVALDQDGIEWEDTMPEMNLFSSPENMFWRLVDEQTGAENHQIAWAFRAGERVKIRIVNVPDSDHPMQHPFHIHGQRFLVLARNGAPSENLGWKDTVLVRTGETVDLLMEASAPGRWMAHCHIAEHLESGMMTSFDIR